ncbi:MAG TPA: hypothetical protein DCW90_03185, partial [Lachnospiraceae bacterium]|nr:hypothetical protein [Lachnospiraceae bacterium]
MKKQFLDLDGLSEVTNFIKKCIADHKEIFSYASLGQFPGSGTTDGVYIDKSENTIYRWDSTSKQYTILAKAIKSVTIVPGAANGTIKITVDGQTSEDIKIKGLGSAAYTAVEDYAPKTHNHTKSEVGLSNVDNTADSEKSVKRAKTAEVAENVDWSNVGNKPTTYPPATHEHNYAGSSSPGGPATSALDISSKTPVLAVGDEQNDISVKQNANGTFMDGEINVEVNLAISGKAVNIGGKTLTVTQADTSSK